MATEPTTHPLTPRPFVIERREAETEDTYTWWLAPRDGDVCRAEPGQFNMIYALGAGEVPISVSGWRDGQIVHTIRDVGGVTATMANLRPGDTVGLRGPYGRGWPMDRAAGADLVLIAGGLGLAPLRSAMQTASLSAVAPS